MATLQELLNKKSMAKTKWKSDKEMGLFGEGYYELPEDEDYDDEDYDEEDDY